MPTPKPILRHQRKPKRQNHYVPGFVYIFQDSNLCKIGLSRKPKQRRYYLSQEYKTDLQIRAIVPTFNMRLTELWMHKIFEDSHVYRTKGLDGYTEWFQVNYLRVKQIQIMLFVVATIVNFAYFIGITFLFMSLSYLVFRR